MAHMNIYVDDEDFHTFRRLKGILKCRTNEETFKKIIEIANNIYNNKSLKKKKPSKN